MAFLKDAEEDYSPRLTALVDVVFLLIIFFLVSTEFLILNRRVKIALPQSEMAQEVPRIKKNVLELYQDGALFFNGKEISSSQLRETLKKADPELPLMIRADKGAAYGEVVKILGVCQNLGFEEIDAAVREPD
ncbi:MAG: biopolymer transporter ExbD [bacterium]|nr:biopolymer transporter ExbD [bacterium]